MNRTQCPHCFTIYVISDEQIRVSQGMVRCGTCKERFQADLVGQKKVEKFDPRRVFIEPISEQEDETDAHVADLIKNSQQVDFQLENFEPSVDPEPAIDNEQDNEQDNDKSSETKKTSDDFIEGQSGADSYEFSEEVPSPREREALSVRKQEAFNSKDRKAVDSVGQKSVAPVDAIEEASVREETSQTIDSFSDSQNDIENFHANDGSLIDEVNQLIEKKIMQPVESARTDTASDSDHNSTTERINQPIEEHRSEALDTPSLADQPQTDQPKINNTEAEFSLSTKAKKPASRWFYALILLIVLLGFSGSLVYQLWLKQAIPWPDDKRLTKTIAPVIEPLKAPIKQNLERFNITIPERRNLSKLELVSARTAPHPTRPSTILLRVSLINGAEITQPLPWLELSLNDSEGRLVSRRSLSPDDYSYNNRIDEKIGPRELKKVTVELLKFPEHATGYELKLLNK